MSATPHILGGAGYRRGFAHALGRALPAWRPHMARLEETGGLELRPEGWTGEPLAITVRGDAVTVCPMCRFGIDYTTTADEAEALAAADLVFARPVRDLADFVAGRAVATVSRRRWLGLKAGWDVRFTPAAAAGLRSPGVRVFRWTL